MTNHQDSDMQDKDYTFEVLVIDRNGASNITKEANLAKALCYSEEFWTEKATIGDHKITDPDLGIELSIHTIDTQSLLSNLIEAGFVLRVKGKKFEELEQFRQPFLQHLKANLKFSNIRILRDDISTKIANDLYPLINKVENTLRRYLILFFTQKIGLDWWSATAPNNFLEKVSSRRNNEKTFTQFCDTDVTLIDFDDLGELIYKQTSGFNKTENYVNKIITTNSLEELESLKRELQGNYTKYFKEAFQNNNFEKKWKSLNDVRNKVAHNNLFVINDLETTKATVEELIKIINDAEQKIDTFKFSVEEQIAIREATIQAVKEAEEKIDSKEKELESLGLKPRGKIDLPYYKIISEEDLLGELDAAQKDARKKGLPYVGLKFFVSRWLREYDSDTTYWLINILSEKSQIEIYSVIDVKKQIPAKALRLAA